MVQKTIRVKKGSDISEWFDNQARYSDSIRILINAAIQVYGKGDLVEAINKKMANQFATELSKSNLNVNIGNQVTHNAKSIDDNKQEQDKKMNDDKDDGNDDKDDGTDPLTFLS